MKLIFKLYFVFFSTIGIAQVGINTTNPDDSAILDVSSTDSGILLPRMTEGQRIGITNPAMGLLIYQTNNSEGFWFFNGTAWQLLSGSNGWELIGNTGTNPSINFIGTTDAEDFIVKTNNDEVMRVSDGGNVGIGTTNPQSPLHIVTNSITPLSIRDGSQMNGRILMSNADGDATWQEAPSILVNDQDWLFASGSTISDPIYHEGPVTIGLMTPTTHTLLIDSGNPVETIARFGSVELIYSRTNALFFNQDFLPLTDNNLLLGSPTRKWTAFYTTNGVIQTSDKREKQNIKDLDLGLKEVLELEPVSFQWKEERVDDFIVPDDEKKVHLGFIAQDVQKVMPEIVETFSWKEYEESPGVLIKEKSDVIAVSYSEMIPVLVKSIQEQEELLKELEEQNRKLKKAFKKAKKKIEKP